MKINYYFYISIFLKRHHMVKTSVKSTDILTLPTTLPPLFMTSLETPRKWLISLIVIVTVKYPKLI